MEKRAFIAVLVSIVIIMLWNVYIQRISPPVEREKQEMVTKEVVPTAKTAPPPPRVEPSTPNQQSRPLPVTEAQPTFPVKEVSVETPNYIARFTTQGARLKSFKLKHYRASVKKTSPLIEMVEHTPAMPYPLGIRLGANTDEAIVYELRGTDATLAEDGHVTLTFEGLTPDGRRIIKQLSFDGSSYALDVAISVSAVPGSAGAEGLLFTTSEKPKGLKSDVIFEGFMALEDGNLLHESASDIETSLQVKSPVAWAGFAYTYFLSAFLPANETDTNVAVARDAWGLTMDLQGQPEQAGGAIHYTLFIGPKVLDLLESFERGLEKSINFGYFAFIAVPLLHVLNFFQQYTHSYGLDIILLTILIKIVLWPLTQKSFVSMKRMQKLQPQMQRIKEKFGDDKEKLNKEMMDLYKRNKVNPLGGCLPMLLQFPVFIGLYNALLTPIELRHASFLWIQDLSRPDWESLPFALFGYHVGVPVLVLLMGSSMFVQQWMSPAIGDPNQRRMMMLMPLIFTVMFVSFPSGLTIYWLVNNLLSIGQQYLINRKER